MKTSHAALNVAHGLVTWAALDVDHGPKSISSIYGWILTSNEVDGLGPSNLFKSDHFVFVVCIYYINLSQPNI